LNISIEEMYNLLKIFTYNKSFLLPIGCLTQLEYPAEVLCPDYLPEKLQLPRYSFRDCVEDIGNNLKIASDKLITSTSGNVDRLTELLNASEVELGQVCSENELSRREMFRELHSVLTYRNAIDESIQEIFNRIKILEECETKLSDELLLENIKNKLNSSYSKENRLQQRRVYKIRKLLYKRVLESFKEGSKS